MKKITMRTTAASASGNLDAGKTYLVSDELAKTLIGPENGPSHAVLAPSDAPAGIPRVAADRKDDKA